ncbi:MAG: imidazolonepropionase [Bacteroidetes bacterium]|jgi:imidazolonepropionase|nr:imidazolonepropionase [Bacteroidota bacterium]HCI71297.1 imidazolonepropionase [Balneola sp.]|tara:strand:- start:43206 stop:44444 length:1239 start_codon:yes stop_codon:yes gene_type:complete
MSSKTLYGPFKQLLTMNGLPLKGSLKDEQLEILTNAGIIVQDGKVLDLGSYSDLENIHSDSEKTFNNNSEQIALPSFIDCHTHICWGGNRVNDYSMRVAGKSYLEIAASGGGISDTVTETRKASEDKLVELILDRAKQHLQRGITTIEVKSGYGLNLDDELKMLRAIKKANEKIAVRLIPTFLGAHIKPKDFDGSHGEYLDFLLQEVVPIIVEEKLATRADIFVEEGAFDIDVARIYAKNLKLKGFDVTMHVDQFHPGGSKLAIEEGSVSADHLEFTDDESCELFGRSETVAVALPGASLGLGMQFTPCRKLLDNNACVAIATDWNPGSAPMGDLITQAAILGASEKLTIAETLAGITFRAARALRIEEGILRKGDEAAFTVFETDDFRNIFYQQGQLKPSATIIGGDSFEF